MRNACRKISSTIAATDHKQCQSDPFSACYCTEIKNPWVKPSQESQVIQSYPTLPYATPFFHHFITCAIPYQTMFSVSSSSDKMSTSEQRITGTEETKLEKLKGDDLIWGRFSSINKIICDLNILLPVIWGIGSQMPTFPKNSMWQTMERCGKKGPWSQPRIPSPDTPKSTWAKGGPEGLQDSEQTSPGRDAAGLEEWQGRSSESRKCRWFPWCTLKRWPPGEVATHGSVTEIWCHWRSTHWVQFCEPPQVPTNLHFHNSEMLLAHVKLSVQLT